MEVKTTMRYHLIAISVHIIEKAISIGEDVEKRKPSYIVGENINWCSHYGKQYGDSF